MSEETCLPFDVVQLQTWLEPIAAISQEECVGMCNVVSHLLHKNGILHVVAGGVLVDVKRLNDPAVSHEENCAVTHYWIELGFNYVVDFRARMWMGAEAQHGVFIPEGNFEYRPEERFQFEPVAEPILNLMAGVSVSSWKKFSAMV